jgi:DNA-binding transcriptional LysR family regulator
VNARKLPAWLCQPALAWGLPLAALLAWLALDTPGIGDHGSTPPAAARGGLGAGSAPSASEALRRMERRLGITQLVRGPRDSHPTVEGDRLAASVGEVLGALARFAAEADAVS